METKSTDRVFASNDEAKERAEHEFLKFQALFYTVMAENPDLSYDQVNDKVVYEHPTFENEDDQAMYDNAAYLVALSQVLSVL